MERPEPRQGPEALGLILLISVTSLSMAAWAGVEGEERSPTLGVTRHHPFLLGDL